MERTLVLSAFAVGWLGWLIGMLGTWLSRRLIARTPADEARTPRLTLLFSLLIPLLVYCATLPERAPFASGQGFGRGFVIGALAALLAHWVGQRTDGERPAEGFAATAVSCGPLFMGVAAVCAPVLWLHDVLTDALFGVAIGWFVNSFSAIYFSAIYGRTAHSDEVGHRMVSIAQGVGFTVTLAAAVALGDYGGKVGFGPAGTPVSWRAILAAYGAAAPFVIFCCALPTPWIAALFSRLPLAGALTRAGAFLLRSEAATRTAARLWRLLPGSLLLLYLAHLLAARLATHPRLVLLCGIGLLVGVLGLWLTDTGGLREEEKPTRSAIRQQNGALTTLLVLAAVMAAYQLMAGVGIAFVLLTAWYVCGLVLHGDRIRGTVGAVGETVQPSHGVERDCGLITALIYGAILCLYRLFEVRFARDLHGVNLTDHYALFGFLLGVLLPILLTGYLAKPTRPGAVETIGKSVVAAALALGVPFVLLLLFGAKCALALYFGLALVAVLPLLQFGGGSEPGADTLSGPDRGEACVGCPYLRELLPALLALAVALALGQWSHHVAPLALYARAAKLRLIRNVAVAIVVLLLATDYGGRLSAWREARRGAVAPDRTGRAAR